MVCLVRNIYTGQRLPLTRVHQLTHNVKFVTQRKNHTFNYNFLFHLLNNKNKEMKYVT